MADRKYGWVLLPVAIDTFSNTFDGEYLSKLARAGAFDLDGPQVESYLSEGGAFAFSDASSVSEAIATLERHDA